MDTNCITRSCWTTAIEPLMSGIPKCCHFAVLGMLFCTVAFWGYPRDVVPEAQTSAFADIWAAIVKSYEALENISLRK